MKENIDMFIKKKIHQEQIKVPESYFKKIDMTLQGLPEERMENTKEPPKLRYRHIVAAAAVFCLLLSGTAYATVNYVQERMLAINENDKKEMADDTRKSVKDVDVYSRKLTEDEKDRMEALLYDYQFQGKFPENELEIVDSKEIVAADTLAFITEDSMFVLPERTLTDEELLQIIDFYYKRDYSLMTSKEDVPSDKLAVDNVLGEDGIEQMKAMISIIYRVDPDNLEASMEADINGVYRIEINDSELGIYRALYDLDAERIVEIEYISGIDVVSEKIEPDNEHFVEVGEELTQIILRLDSNVAIKEIYCDYNITEDKLLARGMVNYIYKLENGECYVVKYNPALDNVTNLFIVPYDAYQQTIDNNVVKQEERGIHRIRISVDVK